MKYQHFHPPATSFYSTYSEILTFSLSWGDFYYAYNKGTLRAQSQMHKDAFGRKSCHTFVWEANEGTKCGHTAGTMLNIHFLVTVDTSTMRTHCGHTTGSQNKINSLEVTFTTRIMKYQHVHPPGTSFCSQYSEIFTFVHSWACQIANNTVIISYFAFVSAPNCKKHS